jgi:hypothetical protein
MRRTRPAPFPTAVIAAIAALAGFWRQPAADPPDRLGEFLAWAHPAGAGCDPAAGARVLEEWDGGLRARYTVRCGGTARDLEGVFLVRRGSGVWQVAGGYEAEAAAVEAALAADPVPAANPAGAPAPAAGGAPASSATAGPDARETPADAPPRSRASAALAPPPDNEDPFEPAEPPPGPPGGDGTPMRALRPARVLQEGRPIFPEALGRARMIGGTVVELLVDVPPDGRPARARTLRGPDPDLGVRQAAVEAALRYRFRPASLGGRPVRSFVPVEIAFAGLPQDSIHWQHRALFALEALVAAERGPLEEARRRLEAGEPFAAATAQARRSAFGAGDWGFVSAATLPAPVRRALHEADVGSPVGPVEAEGLFYLMLKRGEVYYGIRPGGGPGLQYQVVHERHAPRDEELRRIIESDLLDYLAESRRHAYMNEASRLMGIRQTRVEIGQLLIHTDALDPEETRMLGAVVQAAFRAHEALWGPLVPLRPFRQQVLVYALRRGSDHDRLHEVWQAGVAPPPGPARAGEGERGRAGEYIPASRILSIPTEGTEGHLPVPALIHEAIHMLNYERVYGAGVQPSPWFEEGLASYYGLSQVTADLALEPGDIRRSATLIAGGVRLQFDPRARLREYLQGIRESGPVPLRPLLEAGPGDPPWTGPAALRAYNASWTLVHYLLHGERRARRDAFLRYAVLEARGAGGPDAFLRLFGPDFDALEADWHEYEDRL